VSRLSAERGGYGLLEEFGYKPVNRYLPPRDRRGAVARGPAEPEREPAGAAERLFAFIDRALGAW
jgi:hypothetical protein